MANRKRAYVEGAVIRDIGDLIDYLYYTRTSDFVYFKQRIMHRDWLFSMRLSVIMDNIKLGVICEADRNDC